MEVKRMENKGYDVDAFDSDWDQLPDAPSRLMAWLITVIVNVWNPSPDNLEKLWLTILRIIPHRNADDKQRNALYDTCERYIEYFEASGLKQIDVNQSLNPEMDLAICDDCSLNHGFNHPYCFECGHPAENEADSRIQDLSQCLASLVLKFFNKELNVPLGILHRMVLNAGCFERPFATVINTIDVRNAMMVNSVRVNEPRNTKRVATVHPYTGKSSYETVWSVSDPSRKANVSNLVSAGCLRDFLANVSHPHVNSDDITIAVVDVEEDDFERIVVPHSIESDPLTHRFAIVDITNEALDELEWKISKMMDLRSAQSHFDVDWNRTHRPIVAWSDVLHIVLAAEHLLIDDDEVSQFDHNWDLV
jgi:hypothetical protein